ncbi:HEPN domain-containing protein [Leptolyngbya iicbica]|uniref:Uncharacterized protein n=2 Tax=Cyanophyceae TaxID=3028117 RepID=A0A4Q7EE20_9CYAN|nr:HEPN domain-containing protein [Leptolyngbya sp. LK]RZM82044.1 hypothetical protein DYY88_01910 [Leptolyngbya sp. LK]
MDSHFNFEFGLLFTDVSTEMHAKEHSFGDYILRPSTVDEINKAMPYLQMWSQRRGMGSWPVQCHPEWRLQDGRFMSLVFTGQEPSRIFMPSINLAFAISDSEMRVGYFLDSEGGIYQPFHKFLGFGVQNDLGAIFPSRPATQTGDLADLEDILSHFQTKSIDKFVLGSLELFYSLDRLPDHEPIKVLGYFTVLESLLSHAPADNDRADSIRRQLERNLILLDNRLKPIGQSLGFEDFGGIGPRKLMGKLYSYRSEIAHGSLSDSSIETLQKLRNDIDDLWFHNWLRRLVRKVLYATIREPELVRDLK